jgi:RNA polymerase sigma-70 factor (ECF subfamily)
LETLTEVIKQAGFAGEAAADADEALARRIAAGDVNAWEQFFNHYIAWTYRFAYSHLNGNRADAEDLCSDILMTAAKNIRQFNRARGTLDLWLLGIARHRLAHFCRSRKIELPLIPEIMVEEADSDTSIAEVSSEAALLRDVVNRALASLPARQAAVLIGKYIEGYSVDELATSAETTSKAIESLLSRARAAFRLAFTALMREGLGGSKNDRE